MRRLIAFAACFLSLTGVAAANPADALDGLPIDGYRYDYARHCTKSPTPGALAMKSWLEQHSSGVFWGIMRCEKLGPHDFSLHADGRAIDWHLDAHTAWWSGPGGMQKYSVCYDRKGHKLHIDDTTAHRNHIHIGLNRLGARELTSFWRLGHRS